MALGSITTLGIGSSMDLQGILDSQREADEAILDLKTQEIEYQQTVKTELDSVNAQLLSMKTNALNLSLNSTYFSRDVSSSSTDVATATALDGAATGSHRVETTRMASKSSYMSQGKSDPSDSINVPTQYSSTQGYDDSDQTMVLAEGESLTLTQGSGDNAKTFTITAPDGGMTLDDIAAAINTDPLNQDISGNPLVEAQVNEDEDGQFHLALEDADGGSGEAHRVEVSSTNADFTFTAPDVEFSYTMGADSQVYTLTIPPDTSLEALAEMINEDADNPGVSASVIDSGVGEDPYRLVLEADETGEDNRITIHSPLDDLRMEETNGAGYAMTGGQSISFDPPVVITESKGNNTIHFQETAENGDTQDITAVIPDGVYDTPEELSQAVETAMEDASADQGNMIDYQVTIDPETGKMSIQEAGTLEKMTMKWEESSAASTLGFSENQSISPISASLNAEIIVDGIAYQRQDNTNQSDIIPGVTLNLQGTGVTTISVSADTSTVEEELTQMVETYNALVAEIDANDDYDENTDTWGPLSRSSTVKNLTRELQNLFNTVVDTGGAITSLMDLGIETNRDGTITLDAEVLNQQLTDNFDDVQLLFLGTETTTGLADTINDQLGEYSLSTGYIDGEITAIDEKITRLETDYQNSMDQLDKEYETLALQYSELDSYLSSIESTQNYIDEMFSAMDSGD
ncbi:MAG: flagellar filament capping protein FliD [Desulfobacterales bacterium]|nr:flagellar filament capping protein FliD [Desulfobacterales bacterium]